MNTKNTLSLHMRLAALSFTLCLLLGCASLKYYKVQANNDQKSQSLAVTTGYLFATSDSVCVELGVTNWNRFAIELSASAFVLEAGDQKMTPMTQENASQSQAFRMALSKYPQYMSFKGQPPAQAIQKLYHASTIRLSPKAAKYQASQTRKALFCYKHKNENGPFWLRVTGLTIKGKAVTMAPFKFQRMVRTTTTR